MIFSSSRKCIFSNTLAFIDTVITFKDSSTVVSEVNLMARTTTIHYFDCNSSAQKYVVSFPRVMFDAASVMDKEVFLVDVEQGHLIVLDFYNQEVNKIVYQCEELKHPKSDFDVFTYTSTTTFAVNILNKENKTTKFLYYQHPAQLFYEEKLDLEGLTFTKLNESGEMGLFSHPSKQSLSLGIMNAHQRTMNNLTINLGEAGTVRRIQKISKDKLVFLMANNKTIEIYDIFTKILTKLVDITSVKFKFELKSQTQPGQTKPEKNIIYNWVALSDYMAIITRNIDQGAPTVMYLVNYEGNLIGSHPAFIQSEYWYKSKRGKQHFESKHSHKGAQQVDIKEWQVVPQPELVCFLANEGLGLSVEMVEAVVNAMEYDV